MRLKALLLGAGSILALGLAAQAETVTIATVNNGDMIRMQGLTEDFTAKNPDISLEWVTLEENALRQKVTTDIATKGGQFDVLTIGTYEVPIWAKKGWLVALDSLGADYDVDDLLPAIRSGLSVDGKLYAAHSNYPEWPMRSSLEVFDAETLEHIGTHDFGVRWGSLTWVDWHEGHWWMTFANYDQKIGPGQTPYGHKENTVVIQLTEAFEPVQSWSLPKEVLDRFEDMSNSGGSWGPDGFLYLSGHDPAEIYKMTVPGTGSVPQLVEIIPLNIRGQGIAWDRSQPGMIYGIIRATAPERAAGIDNRVTVSGFVEKP